MLIKPKSQNIQVMLNWFNYFGQEVKEYFPHQGGEYQEIQKFRLN